MTRIKVLGGTGYGGSAVVREAAQRGHTVTSYSRTAPAEPVDGVTYVHGSLEDEALLARVVEDADVVFETLAEGVSLTAFRFSNLILLKNTGTRSLNLSNSRRPPSLLMNSWKPIVSSSRPTSTSSQ